MEEEIEVKNAVILGATITNNDQGCLSAWLNLDYGGTGQGFGGYALYLPKSFTRYKRGSSIAGHFIWRVLEIAGVSEWADLVGKTIRVRASHSRAHAIGHITRDNWFEPEREFAELREEGL